MKNEEVIKQFINGNDKVKGGHIFAEHGVLYDYGYHFPMLVRLKDGFILNVGKYSRTTSTHQNECLRNLGNNVIKMTTWDIKEICQGNYDNKLTEKTMEDIRRLKTLEVIEKE